MAIAQRAMTAREWGLLALLSLLWGGSFFFIGVAVKELPPLTLAALRIGLAAIVLWASAPLTAAKLPRNGKALATLALLGLGNNALPFALIAGGKPIWQPASPRSSTRQRRSSPCSSRMSLRPRRS
jgi:drug/metabolite transporter (DMT)-like permease